MFYRILSLGDTSLHLIPFARYSLFRHGDISHDKKTQETGTLTYNMAHRRQLSGFGNLNGSVTRGGVHDDETTKKTLHGNLHPRSYFTEFTAKKAIMYTMAWFYVVGCGLASMAEPFLHLECYVPEGEEPIAYPNASYDGSRCPWVRYGILLGMNKTECSFGRRLVMSILMGGLIGWERRQADRPAGIRTMSLVSLGSCLFTINSAFAFVDGPETWDASRISAAIPSGVGFLGAGLIFKKTSDDDNMVVHGLTTAASVWLSAAVGAHRWNANALHWFARIAQRCLFGRSSAWMHGWIDACMDG